MLPYYILNGQVDLSQFAITEGSTRLSGIGLSSQVAATSHEIALTSLRLELSRANSMGVRRSTISPPSRLAAALATSPLREFEPPSSGAGYDGSISGNVEVNGNLKNPAAKGFRAEARLTLAAGSPAGSQGVPSFRERSTPPTTARQSRSGCNLPGLLFLIRGST